MRYVINAKIKTLAPLSIKMPKPEGGRENEFENFPVMTRGLDEQGNKQQTGLFCVFRDYRKVIFRSY